VVKDSSIAKCRWRFQSVWAWEEQKSIITGKINIVSWNKGLLKIDFDIAVDEIWSKRKYIYKGTRIFELPGK
jgi:hypothetical protein